jgi:hypothetical protein
MSLLVSGSKGLAKFVFEFFYAKKINWNKELKLFCDVFKKDIEGGVEPGESEALIAFWAA